MNRRLFLKTGGTGLAALAALPGCAGTGSVRPSGQASASLPDRLGLSTADLRRLLDAALGKGGEFAELFFEHRVSNSLRMEEDILKESARSISLGVGIRVLRGDQTGYGYTNNLDMESMRVAALTAAAIAASPVSARAAELKPSHPAIEIADWAEPMRDAALDEKIGLVRAAYSAAFEADPRIRKVQASLADETQEVTVVTSDGLLVSDVRPQVRLIVRATAEAGGSRNTGSFSGGGRVGLGFYRTEQTPGFIGRQAALEAVELLSAADPPAGEQTVVLDAGQSGVMVHEAVGHPLEADGNRKRTSIFWDKMGTLVANPLVTIVDDPTLPRLRGSLNMDDEGAPTERTVLIEKGRLVGFLQDRLSAKCMSLPVNGHGRRESYASVPIPRMCNTVLERGEHDPEEIIRSVKRGFFAKTYQGGQVQDTGKFTFSVNLGYRIEDGRLTQPVKNATLIGTNVQILNEVEMIGTDAGLFLGTCGKDGQSAAVTASTPTLRLRRMTVGGRA
jgi:TldD protein